MSLWNRCPSISALYPLLSCDDKRKNQIWTSQNTWWNIKKWLGWGVNMYVFSSSKLLIFSLFWLHECFMREPFSVFCGASGTQKKKQEKRNNMQRWMFFRTNSRVWSAPCPREAVHSNQGLLTGEQIVGRLPFMPVQRFFSGFSEIQMESFVPSIQI